MRGQEALDLGDFDAPVGRDALAKGVHQTLTALEGAGVLDARHAGLVALLRSEATDYSFAHGIARTNYARLIGEHLQQLLELEVPAEEGSGEDQHGDRVTKLSEWLTSRRVDPGVLDASAT